MLITFSGIDCAGKSTQIERLSDALESRGERVVRFWYRPGYSPELDALRKFVRRLRPGALPTTNDPQARARVFQRRGVKTSWVRIAEADTLLQLAGKVRWWRSRGRAVICDRWISDALIDLRLRFSEENPATLLPKLIPLCPEPDHQFLLMLGREEMLRRMAVKQEPFPDAPEVRDRRFALYESLSTSGRLSVVDCERSIEAVHRDILGRVLGR